MTLTPVTETKTLSTEGHRNQTVTTPLCTHWICIFFAVANIIIFILGVAGNGVVIWIAGFKVKKSVNTIWYLSLALSDLIFCCFLPFFVDHRLRVKWIFGRFMCYFSVYIIFLNMFTSIFHLVIISVDRCVIVMFPVWAQNKRTIKKASVIVLLAWIISALVSLPMAFFMHFSEDANMTRCDRIYTSSRQKHIADVSFRFVLGFLIPFAIIIICYVIIIKKLKSNKMAKSTKPFKIMTALIVTFFICWMPFHTFSFLDIKYKQLNRSVSMGKIFGLILASSNSSLNPFLYAFMGKDFKSQCYVPLSKIENALEEGQST